MNGQEAEIAAIRRRADRNAHAHIAQALRLKMVDDAATFVAAIGGAAVMGAGALMLGSEAPQRHIEIAIAIGGALITLVGVWQAVWRPGERSRHHKRWAMAFTEIEDECRLVQAGVSDRSARALLNDLLEIATSADLIAEYQWRKTKRSLP